MDLMEALLTAIEAETRKGIPQPITQEWLPMQVVIRLRTPPDHPTQEHLVPLLGRIIPITGMSIMGRGITPMIATVKEIRVRADMGMPDIMVIVTTTEDKLADMEDTDMAGAKTSDWASERARKIDVGTCGVCGGDCASANPTQAWCPIRTLRDAIATALIEAERRGAERMRESVCDAVRKECTACNGTGYDPRSNPETPGFECEYCGRPMDVIRALPLDKESGS